MESAKFSEEGPMSDSLALNILLSHMAIGRIDDNRLKVGSKFVTLANSTITVCKDQAGMKWLNGAKVLESNIFMYDLGAMVIVDGPVHPLPSAITQDGTSE
ncbi:hypothetical protein J437_LFUL010878 [Ladona fulva]|uniref:FAS1 domain-containing protein n=1 Tax=Ladona fulva TaxID=123851 RepID=A0A8K0KKP3_LADFU|nr:hypothetical protein J437_LFUL010878 [Ladona fulva]